MATNLRELDGTTIINPRHLVMRLVCKSSRRRLKALNVKVGSVAEGFEAASTWLKSGYYISPSSVKALLYVNGMPVARYKFADSTCHRIDPLTKNALTDASGAYVNIFSKAAYDDAAREEKARIATQAERKAVLNKSWGELIYVFCSTCWAALHQLPDIDVSQLERAANKCREDPSSVDSATVEIRQPGSPKSNYYNYTGRVGEVKFTCRSWDSYTCAVDVSIRSADAAGRDALTKALDGIERLRGVAEVFHTVLESPEVQKLAAMVKVANDLFNAEA